MKQGFFILLSILFFSCMLNDSGKKSCLGNNSELFNGTELDGVSNLVDAEDVDGIRSFFKDKNQQIDFQEKKLGYTLLMWAVVSNKKRSVAELLKLGADPNKVNYEYDSPLIEASRFGDLSMMKLLVKYGADVNYTRDTLAPENALVASILSSPDNERLQKVKFLVESGAYVDSAGHGNSTAIDIAVELKALDVAEYLAKKGANVNVPVFKLPDGRIVYLLEMLKDLEVTTKEDILRKDWLIKFVLQHADTTK